MTARCCSTDRVANRLLRSGGVRQFIIVGMQSIFPKQRLLTYSPMPCAQHKRIAAPWLDAMRSLKLRSDVLVRFVSIQ